MSMDAPYPVSVEGVLDPVLSRWLWLVKLILIIPHIVVLAFLLVALIFLTVVAFFAILFTGRYPRGIFDFNVGVLRWSWRVCYYFLGALGTDRYPPFSLKPADYPATLEVEYPENLSRGRVLIKWLLAIPHYVILDGFETGNFWLVIWAGLVLLFTGKYPRGFFDLVIGINRWSLRVSAYILLMRDEYPPIRLSP